MIPLTKRMAMVFIAAGLMQTTFSRCINADERQEGHARSNLQEVAFGMVVYHQSHKTFPSQANFTGRTKLLSWRVHLLPSLGQEKLYRKFRLEETWDSDHNKKLIAEMPKFYADPRGKADARAGETRIQVPIDPKGIFTGGPDGVATTDIPDGVGKTVLIVEVTADRAVPWTKPDDITIDPKDATSGLVDKEQVTLNAAFADGTTQRINKSKVVPALFTRNAADK